MDVSSVWKKQSDKKFYGCTSRLPVSYFDRISVKEGVDLESHEDYDKFIDVTLSKRYSGSHVIFYNKSNFNHQERTCDRCYKMLLGTNFEPKQIHVIW